MHLSGTVALVTGAASGLGEATSRRLADRGARVAVLDRSEADAARVAGEIGGLAAAADVSDAASFEAALAGAVRAFGSAPRIVVSCAGIGTATRILPRDGALTIDAFERTVCVNLIGTYTFLNIAARAMAALDPVDADGARGVIVNTASVAAFDGQIGQAAYSASKGGVVGMTLPIARDLASHLIRVVTIAPGLFDTPLLASLPEEARASLGKQVPHPSRLGKPDEYGALAVHIIENPMLNGEVIRLDGAIRMAPR
jgi:NAD(P)-dependent dehydrogenase (short-subunit alcohol dehydrogenase family)